MKIKIYYTAVLVLTALLLSSCSSIKCEDGRPTLMFVGITDAERSIIEVKEYEAGKGWEKVKRTLYTGDSVVANATDSIGVADMRLATSSFYTFRFVQSNKVCSLYNMQYQPHRQKRRLFGGEVKACTNGFSYSVNGKNYTLPYEENLSYSSSVRRFALRIPKE